MESFVPEWINYRNVRKRFVTLYPWDVEDVKDVEQLIILKDYYNDLSCHMSVDEALLCNGMIRLLECRINKLLE